MLTDSFPMVVRNARPQDLDALGGLALACFEGDFTDPVDGLPSAALASRWVQGRNSIGDFATYFVLEADGRLIGYALYLLIGGLSGIVQLEQIGVLAERRGHGHGKHLISESERLMIERVRENLDLEITKLFLTTSSHNNSAHALYRRAGYNPVSIIPRFFWDVDEEIWVKEILHSSGTSGPKLPLGSVL